MCKYYIIPVLLFFAVQPALAATYEVTARQVNPDGPAQTALCSDENRTCYMSVVFVPASGFQSARDTYLDVAMRFEGEALRLHVLWNREYLFTRGDKDRQAGYAFPLTEGSQTRTIALYKASDLERTDREGSLVLRAPSAVADLEISVSRQGE